MSHSPFAGAHRAPEVPRAHAGPPGAEASAQEHVALEAHLKARYRTLARIRARLLEDERVDRRRLGRLDALAAQVGAAYFEARIARVDAARAAPVRRPQA